PSRRRAPRLPARLLAWHSHVEHRQMRHGVGVIGGKPECNRCARIMTDDGEPRMLEMVVHQLPYVVGDGLLVVASARTRRIAESAEIGRDQREAVGQQAHHVAPFVPGLWPPMQKNDRLLSCT